MEVKTLQMRYLSSGERWEDGVDMSGVMKAAGSAGGGGSCCSNTSSLARGTAATGVYDVASKSLQKRGNFRVRVDRLVGNPG